MKVKQVITKKRFLIFLILIFIISSIIYLYPTRSKVLNGVKYNISNQEYDEEFNIKVDPSTYKLATQNNINIHKKLYDRFDSSIYLEKIFKSDNKINIYISTVTNWRIFKGSCLVTINVAIKDNKITYEDIPNKPIILDEKGRVVPYTQYGKDGGDSIIVTLREEEFYSHENILIKIKGFNHLTYVRNQPFLKEG